MRVRCAVVLGIAGVIGTVVVLTGALAPGVMAPVLPWVTVFLFALGFVGVPVLIVTNVADRIPSRRRTPRHEHSAPRVGREFWRRRRWLAVLLGSCVAISVVTVAVTLVATGGWSPNGRWALKRCQWSLGTNHGFTNICVSHDRWLATNNEVGLAMVGFCSVFVIILCIGFVTPRPGTSWTLGARRTRRPDRRPTGGSEVVD